MCKVLLVGVALSISALAAEPTTFQVMLSPQSLEGNKHALGKGKDLGVYTADLCNLGSVKGSIPRQRVVMEGAKYAQFANVPMLRAVPNAEASLLLRLKAQRDPHSVLGQAGDAFVSLAGTASTAVGIARSSPAAAYVGLGISGLQIGLALLKKNAPDPTIFVTNLFPDEVVLAPGACGTWLFVTYLTHRATDIGPFEVIN